jgi:hypothetical protein
MPNNIAETMPIGYEIISYFNPTLMDTIFPAFCHMCSFARYLRFSRVFLVCDSVSQWAVPLIRFCVNWIVNRCRAKSLMCEIDRAKMHCAKMHCAKMHCAKMHCAKMHCAKSTVHNRSCAIGHCAEVLMCGTALCGTARCFWCRKKISRG